MMNTQDRYGITTCIGSGNERIDQTVDAHSEFIRQLQFDELQQTQLMFTTYPRGYDQGLADKINRNYEGTGYMLLEKVGEKMEATAKGARILVESGLALAMSQAYFCARNELLHERGNPIDVRDAFESIQRMAATWLPAIWKLDARLVPQEITANTLRDGAEDEDLAEVIGRIPDEIDERNTQEATK